MKKNIQLGGKYITPEDWDQMCRQAEREHPDECCGVFLEKLPSDEAPLEWVPCRNIQNELHASVPAFFPRKASSAYVIDPTDWFSIQKRIDRKEVELAVIYHSHIEAPAYFSEEDHHQAMWDDLPKFPKTIYLILSVMHGRVDHWKAFCWCSTTKKFVGMDEKHFSHGNDNAR